jgi:hypothetical protein
MKEVEVVKKAQLIWMALVGSCFIYGIALFLMTGMKIDGQLNFEFIHIILAAYSFFIFVGVMFMRKMFLNINYIKNKFTLNGQLSVEKTLNHMLTMNIISWALMDSIVINGMIISKLMSDFRPYLIFLTIGLILLMKTKPRFHETLQDLQRSL